MAKPNILCIDDQREVLATIKKDVQAFEPIVTIHDCESASEAEDLLNDLANEGEQVAVIICDHIMPGENGVDFLIRTSKDKRFVHTKKMLLTGLATHRDTIQAINEAQVDYYIEKPWDEDEFSGAVKRLLTQYVVDAGMDYSEMADYLDQETLAIKNE
ncbi:MAG: response regulator [Caldithrix sp.]|nr:response regulator [Caldithrix sp.]